MAGRGPIFGSILPKLDRTGAICDAPAKKFKDAYATRLACGIYTVLSSMYAVREWSIEFVEQSHINNARNWMAAVCHEIKETVSLERCKCGVRYEQWGRRPAPPCSKCEKIHIRKGKHHLARLALSRAEVKASEPSVIAAMKKVKEKERKSNILGKL